MRSIIYASRETEAFDPARLDALLAEARVRNAAEGITGLLLYAGGSFLQLLEGDAEAVESTYGRIAADPRHADVRLLARDEVGERMVGDWSMGFERPEPASLPGYKPSTTFPLVNPDLVQDGAVARTLLRAYAGRG